MGRFFGSNGIRAIVNQDLTLELISQMATSSAHFLGKRIAVGRDGRTSSPLLRDAVASSLLSIGCDVYDMGEIPTPALQFLVKQEKLDGGIMITASHNPPEFNGIKVMASDGVEVSRDTEDKIEDLYLKGGPETVPWNQVGKVHQLDVLESYIQAVISQVDPLIKEAGLKVALDTGNGVSVLTAPEVASRLGCKVYTLNTEIDGEFPGRGSEPTPNNLTELRELILATGSDFGIGFDGDGDRSIIMDEKGDAVWGDKSLSLVTQWFMEDHPNATLVTAISSSRKLEEVVQARGGKIHWTKVGSVDISRVMVEKGYLLGGEENGGIMYGPHHPVRDGSMVLALFLNILYDKKKPLSELIAEQPLMAKGRDKVPCPRELNTDVLRILPGKVDAPKIDTTDGLKLTYTDESWILIRPSGTEPIFRVYAEAETEEQVEALIQRYKDIVKEIIESLS